MHAQPQVRARPPQIPGAITVNVKLHRQQIIIEMGLVFLYSLCVCFNVFMMT